MFILTHPLVPLYFQEGDNSTNFPSLWDREGSGVSSQGKVWMSCPDISLQKQEQDRISTEQKGGLSLKEFIMYTGYYAAGIMADLRYFYLKRIIPDTMNVAIYDRIKR